VGRRRRFESGDFVKRFVAVVSAMSLLLTACGPSSRPSSPPPSASNTATPAVVRLALDWTPNTDHTGFYVARHNGWYRDAGIDLRILPYSSQTPETLLGVHQAECGISFQDALTFAVAAGVEAKSVMAILQRTASKIAVLDSSTVRRPKDLDGKVYGSFGYPNEVPTVRYVVQHDGGKGSFKTIVIDTLAYEALYAKRVDFTIAFTAWEGVEAAQRGIGLRYFDFTNYGFPDFYQVVLACDSAWLTRQPDVARRFVAATVRGFDFAAKDPAVAAQILVDENKGAFDANPNLPKASAELLARDRYYVDESGKVGTQTLAKWRGYSSFLYDQGLLVDASGKPVTSPPDYAALFTNDYLP
jgi:ABC-type nitrate/sulfonate/bicarbonate transport system substrate-binding protein